MRLITRDYGILEPLMEVGYECRDQGATVQEYSWQAKAKLDPKRLSTCPNLLLLERLMNIINSHVVYNFVHFGMA